MKYSRLIFFFFLIGFIISHKAYSQSFYTVAQEHHLSYENRVIALGQATAVLNNYGSYHVNPAIPYKDGVLGLNSFVPSFNVLTFKKMHLPGGKTEEINIQTYNPAISVGLNKWSFSASYDYLEMYEIETTNPSTGEEISFKPNYHIIRGNAGYQLLDDFSIGVGIAHIKDFQGYGWRNFEKYEHSGFTYSLGGFYSSTFNSEYFTILPQAGLAFTDIGKDFKSEGNYASLPPAQIRLALGIDFIHKKEIYKQSVASLGIYSGYSKYLSRREEDGSRPTGISAIFTTWNSLKWFNGTGYETITVGDQISKSIGIEAGILETLYLRFGTFGGADFWVRPQTNYGVALDFYYVSFSYAHVHYNKTDRYIYGDKNQSAFQIQLRIPLDEKPHSTLLSELF